MEKTYTLTVTVQDVELIGQALGELPLKLSLNLFGKLRMQCAAQDAPPDLKQEEGTTT